MRHLIQRVTPAVLAALTLSACAESGTGPGPVATALGTGSGAIDASAVKFWEAGATVAWNARATELAAVTPVDVGRMYVYLALAQLRAAEAAAELPGPHPPVAGAIGGASAAVLAAFFPAASAQIEEALDAQEAAAPWPGAKHENFAAGEAIGRAAAARVLAYAAGDGTGLTDPGVAPEGDQHWKANGGPTARGGLGARPFFMTSGSEFRPAPPPLPGSAEFATALAEVRHIADTRTAEQTAIAIYWNVNQSPRSDAAIMAIARELIVSHHRRDAEAARIMFLMSAASFDAIIGCFDAKYHYWLLRPVQADPGIVTQFPTPPHPSYPSAHSCVSGAMTGVLASVFPDESERLAAIADEASISRLFAGIHYRFDMVAGLALGRAAAAKALAADLDEVAVN